MSFTPRLGLPFLLPNQAQKHVTLNDALGLLDAIVQLAVLSAGAVTQPDAPEEGDVHILGDGAAGASWAGQAAGSLAAFRDGVWQFLIAGEGWLAFDRTQQALLVRAGGEWRAVSSLPLAALGINTAADPANRLAVKADQALFSHDDQTPGTGDMRVVLNRANASATASLVFQEDFDALAEFGLTGGSGLNLKVNLPGTGWSDILTVDPASGAIGMGTLAPAARLDLVVSPGPLPVIPAAVILRLLNAPGEQTTFITEAIANNGDLSLRRANGTPGTLTAVQAGNNLGQISWLGFDGSAYSISQARIQADAAENWTPTGHGVHMDFAVTQAGSTSRVKRLRLTDRGWLALRDDLTPACKLDVGGPVRVGSYGVGSLPPASAGAGQIIYVTDEAGGAVLAFSDGTAWRRTTDRAVVS